MKRVQLVEPAGRDGKNAQFGGDVVVVPVEDIYPWVRNRVSRRVGQDAQASLSLSKRGWSPPVKDSEADPVRFTPGETSMKRRVLTAAVLGAAAWFGFAPATASAFGGKLFRGGAGGSCGGCTAPAPAACGTGGYAQGGVAYSTGTTTGGDCGVAVAAAPTYTTQTVTRYRQETRQEKYTYTASEAVTSTEARTVTEYLPLTQGFVIFDEGSGLEELLAAWSHLPRRIISFTGAIG